MRRRVHSRQDRRGIRALTAGFCCVKVKNKHERRRLEGGRYKTGQDSEVWLQKQIKAALIFFNLPPEPPIDSSQATNQAESRGGWIPLREKD